MAATTTLLTVEAYSKIADPPEGRYELHHGELVLVPAPVKQHVKIQDRSLKIIWSRLNRGFEASKEFPFRPLAEYEVWVCDIGIFEESKWDEVAPNGWFPGSPDIVIEVLSPSNTAQEMSDREKTCFEGGCKQFWVLDPKRKSVRVSFPDGHPITYASDSEIPLEPFGQGSIRVSEIFPA
jgi:Uma2 family endonuclease